MPPTASLQPTSAHSVTNLSYLQPSQIPKPTGANYGASVRGSATPPSMLGHLGVQRHLLRLWRLPQPHGCLLLCASRILLSSHRFRNF